MKRRSVLLLAEMANPEWPSVPLIGWQNAVYLRELANTHLVTQIRNKRAIERKGWVEGEDFTVIDSEAIAKVAYRLGMWLGAKNGKGWTTGMALASMSYYYFEYLVWKKFGGRIKAGEFDVVHRVTPVSPTSQSLLAAKCARYGVPMIIGPLNGGVKWPKEFRQAQHAEREWLSYVRSVYKFLPGYRSSLRHAACLLVGSKATLADIPHAYHHKCIYFPENGIDPQKFQQRAQPWSSGPLKAIFVGRLVPYKGLDMAIEALAPLIQVKMVTFDIVGDGPMMQSVRDLSKSLKVDEFVKFHGNVAHESVSDLMASAHVLCFPSIREFGGGVVLEAMATGVVPIVVDYAGPGELVDEKIGYKIKLSSRTNMINELRNVFERIVLEADVLKMKSLKCLDRTESIHTWPRKAEMLLDLYDQVSKH